MTVSEDGDDLLHREAELLAHYLVGRTPGAELAERYVAGCRRLFAGEPEPRDRARIAFVRRRPWSLPYLDAAAGVLAPRSLLRRKALLMTAVLEATPDFVDDFLPRPVGTVELFARGLGLGVLAATKALVGFWLWPLASRVGGAPG